MALSDLTEHDRETIRNIARRSWSTEESEEELIILDREDIQQTDGGYWVPALVFVSDEQVRRKGIEA